MQLALVSANTKWSALDREPWSASDASLKKDSLPRQPNSTRKCGPGNLCESWNIVHCTGVPSKNHSDGLAISLQSTLSAASIIRPPTLIPPLRMIEDELIERIRRRI